MATCIFKKNQTVVYASNGLCDIEDVTQMSFISGEPKKLYYILRPKKDRNSTIYIPHDNDMLISKMRIPINVTEIEKLITDVKVRCWIEDRKQRNLYYKELFAMPTPASLLSALKSILLKHVELTEAGKKLCAIDKDAYNNALGNLKDEFTFAFEGDEKKALAQIKNALGNFPQTI